MTGVWVLVAAVVLAVLLGVLLRARSGRVRTTAGTVPEQVGALLDGTTPVTLVQVSTEFCAPCRQAARQYTEFVAQTGGVRHVELDVTERPELARELHVLSTPTTLGVDAGGRELFRISGVPVRATLAETVRAHVV